MNKRGIYIIIGLLIIIVSIFAINATVDKNRAWHDTNNILISFLDLGEVDYRMTLQEAINDNAFVEGATQSHTTGVPNPGHNADEILVSVNNGSSFQLLSKIGLCEDGGVIIIEYSSKPFCAAIGTWSEGWYMAGGRIKWALCEGHEAICKYNGTSEEGWYDSVNDNVILMMNCTVRSKKVWYNPTPIGQYHYANETEVIVDGTPMTLQEVIDSRIYCS